ncbi:hypothetical protein DFH09DRAFT_1284840 [Mycena vulgaris]|nr:hypothetical protein DFH09DRAFT_1284840 [Mycena vulgaris]
MCLYQELNIGYHFPICNCQLYLPFWGTPNQNKIGLWKRWGKAWKGMRLLEWYTPITKILNMNRQGLMGSSSILSIATIPICYSKWGKNIARSADLRVIEIPFYPMRAVVGLKFLPTIYCNGRLWKAEGSGDAVMQRGRCCAGPRTANRRRLRPIEKSAEGRFCELQGHAIGKRAGDKGWGWALRNRLGATPTSPFRDKPSLSHTFAAKEAGNSGAGVGANERDKSIECAMLPRQIRPVTSSSGRIQSFRIERSQNAGKRFISTDSTATLAAQPIQFNAVRTSPRNDLARGFKAIQFKAMQHSNFPSGWDCLPSLRCIPSVFLPLFQEILLLLGCSCRASSTAPKSPPGLRLRVSDSPASIQYSDSDSDSRFNHDLHSRLGLAARAVSRARCKRSTISVQASLYLPSRSWRGSTSRTRASVSGSVLIPSLAQDAARALGGGDAHSDLKPSSHHSRKTRRHASAPSSSRRTRRTRLDSDSDGTQTRARNGRGRGCIGHGMHRYVVHVHANVRRRGRTRAMIRRTQGKRRRGYAYAQSSAEASTGSAARDDACAPREREHVRSARGSETRPPITRRHAGAQASNAVVPRRCVRRKCAGLAWVAARARHRDPAIAPSPTHHRRVRPEAARHPRTARGEEGGRTEREPRSSKREGRKETKQRRLRRHTAYSRHSSLLARLKSPGPLVLGWAETGMGGGMLCAEPLLLCVRAVVDAGEGVLCLVSLSLPFKEEDSYRTSPQNPNKLPAPPRRREQNAHQRLRLTQPCFNRIDGPLGWAALPAGVQEPARTAHSRRARRDEAPALGSAGEGVEGVEAARRGARCLESVARARGSEREGLRGVERGEGCVRVGGGRGRGGGRGVHVGGGVGGGKGRRRAVVVLREATGHGQPHRRPEYDGERDEGEGACGDEEEGAWAAEEGAAAVVGWGWGAGGD